MDCFPLETSADLARDAALNLPLNRNEDGSPVFWLYRRSPFVLWPERRRAFPDDRGSTPLLACFEDFTPEEFRQYLIDAGGTPAISVPEAA